MLHIHVRKTFINSHTLINATQQKYLGLPLSLFLSLSLNHQLTVLHKICTNFCQANLIFDIYQFKKQILTVITVPRYLQFSFHAKKLFG